MVEMDGTDGWNGFESINSLDIYVYNLYKALYYLQHY